MATKEEVEALLAGAQSCIVVEKAAMAQYLADNDMGGVRACLMLIGKMEAQAAAYALVLS